MSGEGGGRAEAPKGCKNHVKSAKKKKKKNKATPIKIQETPVLSV